MEDQHILITLRGGKYLPMKFQCVSIIQKDNKDLFVEVQHIHIDVEFVVRPFVVDGLMTWMWMIGFWTGVDLFQKCFWEV